MEYLMGAGALGMAITALVYCHKWGTVRVSEKIYELAARQTLIAFEEQKQIAADSDARHTAAMDDLESELESVHAIISQAAEQGAIPGDVADIAVSGIIGLLKKDSPARDADPVDPDQETPT